MLPKLQDNRNRFTCKTRFQLELLTDLVVDAGKIDCRVEHHCQSRPDSLVEAFDSNVVPVPEASPERRRLPCCRNCAGTMPISRKVSAARSSGVGKDRYAMIFLLSWIVPSEQLIAIPASLGNVDWQETLVHRGNPFGQLAPDPHACHFLHAVFGPRREPRYVARSYPTLANHTATNQLLSSSPSHRSHAAGVFPRCVPSGLPDAASTHA